MPVYQVNRHNTWASQNLTMEAGSLCVYEVKDQIHSKKWDLVEMRSKD
jgi:hypothetical protein